MVEIKVIRHSCCRFSRCWSLKLCCFGGYAVKDACKMLILRRNEEEAVKVRNIKVCRGWRTYNDVVDNNCLDYTESLYLQMRFHLDHFDEKKKNNNSAPVRCRGNFHRYTRYTYILFRLALRERFFKKRFIKGSHRKSNSPFPEIARGWFHAARPYIYKRLAEENWNGRATAE